MYQCFEYIPREIPSCGNAEEFPLALLDMLKDKWVVKLYIENPFSGTVRKLYHNYNI